MKFRQPGRNLPGGKVGIVHRSGVKVEYLGESRIKFICPEGHVTREILKTGPRGFQKPMNPEMVKKLALYWADRVTYRCRKCKG